MYRLRFFKVADVLIQLLIVLAAVLRRSGYQSGLDAVTRSLFWLGSWQIVSCLVHRLAVPQSLRGGSRRIYERVLQLVLVSGAVVFLLVVLNVNLFFLALMALYALVTISPVMALWYFLTCLVETQRHARRPRPTFC